MKRLLFVSIILFLLSFYAGAKDTAVNFIMKLDQECFDLKNYVSESKVDIDYKGEKGKGTVTYEQYVTFTDIAFGKNSFKVKTLLLDNDKVNTKDYVVYNDIRMAKPIKLIDKTSYKDIMGKISEDEKKIFSDIYREKDNYFILDFQRGTAKKIVEENIRSILDRIGYQFNKSIVWEVSFNDKKICGEFFKNNELIFYIGDKKLTGKAGLGKTSYKLGDKNIVCKPAISSLSYDYSGKVIEGKMSLRFAQPKLYTDLSLHADDLTDEELAFFFVQYYLLCILSLY